MPKYQLKYFNARARGEIIRLLFALQKVKFEDTRFDTETWPAEKPKLTFGQLPVLYVDGKEYSESGPIQRYLAREFGRYGANNQEAFEIDEVMSICEDLFEKYIKVFFEKDETAKADLKKKFDEEHAPRYLGNIEKLVSKKGKEKGYCVGKKLSLGDIAIFHIVEGRVDDAGLKKFPHVQAIVNKVKDNPDIKAYIATRDPKALDI